MERMTKDEYYLDIAKSVSKRSTCLKRKYGAVIVNNNRIISTGYNGAPHDCINCCDAGVCDRMNVAHNSDYTTCRAVHAEMNAVIQATFSEMKDATLYLVGFDKDGAIDDPDCCPMCKRCIINAGIKKIVFGNDVGVVRNAYTHDWIADFDSKFKKEKPKKEYKPTKYTVAEIVDCFDRIMVEQNSHHRHILSVHEKLFLIYYLVSNYSSNDYAELITNNEMFTVEDIKRIKEGIESIMGEYVKLQFDEWVNLEFDYDKITTPFIERFAMALYLYNESFYVDTMGFKHVEQIESNRNVFDSYDYARVTKLIFQYAKQVDLKAW